jgi:hypothetical protein
MVDVNDVKGLRLARTELSKRGIDTMRADIRVMHGVLYIRGTVTPLMGYVCNDVRHEVEHIAHLLRQKPEIKDVVVDCSFIEGTNRGGAHRN